MEFIWNNTPVASWIISIVLLLAVYAGLFYVYSKIVKRTSGFIFLGVSCGVMLVSLLFCLHYVFVLGAMLSTTGITIALFSNLGDLRKFLANPFKISRTKNSKVSVEKVYNRKEFYKVIEDSVIALSKTRTGAIMTFEKNTSLAEVIKNGIVVDAPVTSELITTIFYPGTRLHDGAVVIRDNMIVAASVFYTPTTKPFAGKYGSRHRAAIGISEISDAVTVVVSEETGRISFAIDGELEPVTQDNFLRVFENYMDGGVKQE